MQIFLSKILKNALLWFILAAFHTTAETKTFENENEVFLAATNPPLGIGTTFGDTHARGRLLVCYTKNICHEAIRIRQQQRSL